MRILRLRGIHRLLLILAATLLAGVPSHTQSIDQQLEHLKELVAATNDIRDNLGADGLKMLSTNGFGFVNLGDQSEFLQGVLNGKRASDATAPEDFLSRLAGNTQSETSVAWCDSNAVIGWNDSGSFIKTLLVPGTSPSGSFSFVGFGASSNHGAQFTDKGVLLPDPLPAGTTFLDLFGDPVVRCKDSLTFYFASLANRFFPFSSAIAVMKSTDGGQSFGNGVVAAAKGRGHFLDKPWMDVKDNNIYVTYTDFDFSTPPRPVCGFQSRTAIEFVRSTNGGLTWSAPQVIDTACGIAFVQGSQAAIGLGNDLYVGWERYPGGLFFGSPPREIRIRKSVNAGASFGPIVTAQSPVRPVGSGFVMQGVFRNFLDLQGLAVDRSGGPNSGNVYITFQDGSNLNQTDFFAFPGCTGFPPPSSGPKYCFADVFATRSTNGGSSWSAPVRINDDPITSPVDQFQPSVAVDKNGDVGVLFYDRRRDARNFLMDAFLARSTDGGLSWSNQRLTSGGSGFPSIHFQDLLVNAVYQGDYIGIAAEKTLSLPGFIAAWGDNSLGDPNVQFAKR